MTKRKKPNPHYVPLTDQMVEILADLRKITGGKDDDYVFPSVRKGRHLSENTFKTALAIMGIEGDRPRRTDLGNGVVTTPRAWLSGPSNPYSVWPLWFFR